MPDLVVAEMIAPRNMITADDRRAVYNFLEAGGPLSGYLAGKPHGGAAVQRLEEMWCTKFGRRHAIAVNSATSGLLAACEAVGLGGEGLWHVGVPALSMSATAAMPNYLGKNLSFLDVDQYGNADPMDIVARKFPCDAVVLTTVFGHPIDRRWLENSTCPLILDNAQGILSAYDDGRWSEGMGHITVTSFNVHKQINAGEGGIVSTDDDVLAGDMRDFINHGENSALRANDRWKAVGLNLRMTELSAVLALSQMARIEETIGGLEDLCNSLRYRMPSAFTPLAMREGCRSARYCYAFEVKGDGELANPHKRDAVVDWLTANGVPAIPMYRPLYELPAFAQYARSCPVAERMADSLVVLELCSWRFEDDLPNVARVLEEASKL